MLQQLDRERRGYSSCMLLDMRRAVLAIVILLLCCLIGMVIYPTGARLSYRFRWSLPLSVRNASPDELARRAVQMADIHHAAEVLEALLEGGFHDDARQLVRLLLPHQSEHRQWFAYRLAPEAVRTGDIQLVRQILSGAEESEREQCCFFVVKEAARWGNLQAAYQFYRELQHPFWCALAAAAIGEAMFRAGRTQAGEAWLNRSARLCQQISDAADRATCLAALACTRARVGDLKGALHILSSIRQPAQRIEPLITIAIQAYKVGQLTQAQKWLKQAERDIENGAIDGQNMVYYTVLARAEIGDLRGAFKQAAHIQDKFLRQLALSDIASKAAGRGHLNQALAVLPLLPEEQVLWMRFSVARDRCRQAIARALALRGHLDDAETVAKGITGITTRIEANAELAKIYARQGERQRAWDRLEDAYQELLNQTPDEADPANIAQIAGVLRQLKHKPEPST